VQFDFVPRQKNYGACQSELPQHWGGASYCSAPCSAAVCLDAGAARAKTSFKATKKQAGYIVRDNPATQMCAQCLYFIAPNDCVVVQGPIGPLGWCNYYGD
jgi:hypothetical protein